jgi:hypothetical protein
MGGVGANTGPVSTPPLPAPAAVPPLPLEPAVVAPLLPPALAPLAAALPASAFAAPVLSFQPEQALNVSHKQPAQAMFPRRRDMAFFL